MRRRLILLLAGFGLAAILTALLWPRAREPQYQGKSLSQWLEGYSRDADPSAAAAVHGIGTNAVPWLLKWICYERSDWREKVGAAIGKLPRRLKESPLLEPLRNNRAIARQEAALSGFNLLGPQASSAVPELSRFINSSKSRHVVFAINALSYTGKEALPGLLSALTNQQVAVRSHVAYVVAWMAAHGTDATIAVPILVQCARDKDQTLAQDALDVLGQLRLEPQIAVPCLTSHLTNSSVPLRMVSAMSLARFGPDARPGLPSLVDALKDSNPVVREAVTNALLKISPESLPKAAQEN